MHRCQDSVLRISKTLITLCVAACLVITLPHSAEAQEPIVLVNPPALLEEATSKALVAWQLRLRSIEAVVPSESMPGARDSAQALSATYQARAVVWLTSNDDGPALWVYDADDDRVAVRKLSVTPPFDEASAASVALSIKTLLMHSNTAPAEERFGAEPNSTILEEPVARATMPAAMTWFFEAQGSGRHSLANDDSLEMRVALGISRLVGPMEVGAALVLGPGRTIAAPEFRGHYSDIAFATHLRYPMHWGSWSLTPSVGASLHATKISGTLSENNRVVAASRENPSLAAGVFATRSWERIRFGIGVRTDLFLRSQRYLVKDEPVLDLPTADVEVGTYVALPFR
jgi:hypothetical protein